MTRFSRHRPRGLTLLELLVVLVILMALGSLMIPLLSWVGERSQNIATRENLLRLRELLINRYYPDMGELPRPRLDRTTTAGPNGEAIRVNHPQLVYLFVNPDTHEDNQGLANDLVTGTGNMLSGRRWQGPYIMHSGSEFYAIDTDGSLTTGTNYTSRYGSGDSVSRIGDPTVTDAWGNPIVIQEPDLDSDPSTPATQIERQHTRLVSGGQNGRIDTPPDVLMPTSLERVDDLVIYLFRHDEHEDDHLTLEP